MTHPPMDQERAARCFAELGNGTRLAIVRLLVRAGPVGMAVGEIRDAVEVPNSTLSHHIAHLLWAGLITQEREGRVMRCRACMVTLAQLTAFMTDECCLGVPGRTPAVAE